MEKYSRKNLKAIQTIVQNRTGAAIAPGGGPHGYQIRKLALSLCCLLCFVALCAFSYAKFSALDSEKAGFGCVYQGNGKFEVVVANDSDRELKLQDKVKVMQWSTSEEVEGDKGKIKMDTLTIAPHSQGILSIDISEGYDVDAMEANLPEGDSYYFVLTNNNFAFGQDWMCFFDFEIEQTEDVARRLAEVMEQNAKELPPEKQYGTGELLYPEWVWPTVSRKVSAPYGEQANGAYSDHVSIVGESGDEIYAVTDGTVAEVTFDPSYGNVLTLDLGDGITVKYGHLKETKVSQGDTVAQGQVIATLGKTGMATGPNLLFGVSIHGEDVNPLAE